ncbi:hypothetical protein HN748_05225 [Candidatus Peregrinibacteria bacterium]|jgi:hypothetical protein|nr:hypothetical protein [Candidatus Peregrinibacteria bacterium]MBT7703610.1 hypothetical protein [Candidatus Peregrinibacteria bacterium]
MPAPKVPGDNGGDADSDRDCEENRDCDDHGGQPNGSVPAGISPVYDHFAGREPGEDCDDMDVGVVTDPLVFDDTDTDGYGDAAVVTPCPPTGPFVVESHGDCDDHQSTPRIAEHQREALQQLEELTRGMEGGSRLIFAEIRKVIEANPTEPWGANLWGLRCSFELLVQVADYAVNNYDNEQAVYAFYDSAYKAILAIYSPTEQFETSDERELGKFNATSMLRDYNACLAVSMASRLKINNCEVY